MTSKSFLLFALALIGCLLGCTQETATPSGGADSVDVQTYKTSLTLGIEPDQVVSIIDARASLGNGLGEPDHANHDHDGDGHPDHAAHDHDAHAGHDHDGHGHNEHVAHDHDGDGHPDHAAHEHDTHAGHDHDGHGHDQHVAHDHDGDGHPDHAAHDHDAHAGHDHDGHGHAGHAHKHAGKPITVIGKVGGAPGAEVTSPHHPFQQNKASFVMFDPSFESAHGEGHEHAEGHECHFCQSKAQNAEAIVHFVGSDGKPLPFDARELGIKKDDLIVVKGHADMVAGILTIEAEGFHIRQ